MAPTAAQEQKSGVSKSGITTDESGQRHIPASLRPDGTLRKEIRVRPGYRPPEDVEVYKNRSAESWKNRGKGGIPGAEPIAKEEGSAAANKNAKRRESRKKAAATATTVPEVTKPAAPEPVKEDPVLIDPEAEKAKEAKKLTKKLRQARELKDKKEQGDALLPEQFEKVIRINELIRQLDKLGFDATGEKKEENTEAEK